MQYTSTPIEGPVIITPKIFGDSRGYFFESFSLKEFQENVADITFVQDNQSFSAKKGVLRGMHFQKGEAAQAKLVRVVSGRVLDVAVDIRKGSPTFGKHIAVELDGVSCKMLFIPRGFAHGFLVLEENTIFQYKCDNYYNAESEGSFAWNDPQVGIEWGISEEEVILSAKDAIAPPFSLGTL